jgi:hypothetical protein
MRFYIESELPRVRCSKCGVHTQKVPWALHDSDYTYAFELRVAVLAAKSPTNLVSKLMRIKWDTVGNSGSPHLLFLDIQGFLKSAPATGVQIGTQKTGFGLCKSQKEAALRDC